MQSASIALEATQKKSQDTYASRSPNGISWRAGIDLWVIAEPEPATQARNEVFGPISYT